MTPSANDLYRAAQRLIKSGQPVFPCRSTYIDERHKDKAPMTKNGVHDATLDIERVKAWWKSHRDAALAFPTGIVWDVLDVDVKREQDGRVHLPYLQRLGLLNGCQRVVKTPSGGWHLYFRATTGLTNKASATLGLDVRSKGGYVLAPPSYIKAQDYEGVYEDMGPTEGHTDEPLNWDLIRSVLEPINTTTNKPIELLGYERRASLASLRGWLSERKEGERNNALHWAVCRCIDNNIDPHELTEVAVMLGLSEDEVNLTVDSALRRAGLSADELDTEAEALFGK